MPPYDLSLKQNLLFHITVTGFILLFKTFSVKDIAAATAFSEEECLLCIDFWLRIGYLTKEAEIFSVAEDELLRNAIVHLLVHDIEASMK
jgi:hypothetical protein